MPFLCESSTVIREACSYLSVKPGFGSSRTPCVFWNFSHGEHISGRRRGGIIDKTVESVELVSFKVVSRKPAMSSYIFWSCVMAREGRQCSSELGTLSPGIKLEFSRIPQRKGNMDIGFCQGDSKWSKNFSAVALVRYLIYAGLSTASQGTKTNMILGQLSRLWLFSGGDRL